MSLCMQGEVWHVHSSLVRSAPTAGSLKHVLLHAVQVDTPVLPRPILPWNQEGQYFEENVTAAHPSCPTSQGLWMSMMCCSSDAPMSAQSLQQSSLHMDATPPALVMEARCLDTCPQAIASSYTAP